MALVMMRGDVRTRTNSREKPNARRAIALSLALAFAALVLVERPVTGQRAQDGQRWLGTWFAATTARVDQTAEPAPASPVAGSNGRELVAPPAVMAVAPSQVLTIAGQSPLHFHNQTLRQIIHITVGGSRLRVVVSNTFGTAPLTIGAAGVALRDKDATIVASSSRVLAFGGIAHTTVPAGAILVSDPVDLAVPDFADLAIDLYLPDDTAAMKSPITTHPASWQTNYVSPSGNHVEAVAMPVEATTAYWRSDRLPSATWFFLTRLEVLVSGPAGAIVTLGDSITDGTASTIDENNRWPDHLARRLALAGIRLAVLNAGIGGNRVLNDGNGPSALARFDRDVIAQPGVTDVIVLEGINDIGQARQNASPSAADLIAAHKQMIERAHARGLRIYGATLTPFEGAAYWTPEGEAKRRQLNDWIRTGNAYDAVFDFDAAVRDPDQPTKTLARYDSGDHLHLNAAGYQAMANAIDLTRFRSR
jgi:lysophospholipase L1-like esterase